MQVIKYLSLVLIVICNAEISMATVGANAYKGKDPIGGGLGYTKYVDPSKAAYVVSNLVELKSALAKARAGEVVYIKDGVEIDATGERNIKIPGGVTLAGNRGKKGSQGPLIKATLLELPAVGIEEHFQRNLELSYLWNLFLVGGPGVRVTGIRIQGPDTETRTEAYEAPNCNGILCCYPDLEVDNCEIWGWTLAAVELKLAGKGAYIHHNYLHHCRRRGLGYGICLGQSQALIECNRFSENRHDIAGTGRAGTSYLARYNISEAHDVSPGYLHAFDMHGNHESRPEGTEWPQFAGESVVICYNTFKSDYPRDCISIRGEPRKGLTIFNNLYENARYGVRIDKPCRNALIYGDVFPTKPTIAYYLFDDEGNILNGKRMPAIRVKELPVQSQTNK